MNGSRIRKETVADSKLSGYVWTRKYLDNTSWKVREYGIYARVVDV